MRKFFRQISIWFLALVFAGCGKETSDDSWQSRITPLEQENGELRAKIEMLEIEVRSWKEENEILESRIDSLTVNLTQEITRRLTSIESDHAMAVAKEADLETWMSEIGEIEEAQRRRLADVLLETKEFKAFLATYDPPTLYLNPQKGVDALREAIELQEERILDLEMEISALKLQQQGKTEP